jgi:hypothetical protein
MTRVPDEPQTWPVEADPETLLGDLRRQIEAARSRLSEHREQMKAAGLIGPRPNADDAETPV